MKSKEEYQPDWRSAEEIAEWLGIHPNTLILWRTTKGLAWTNMGAGKVPMYDKKQITAILNQNSTYAIIGDKQLTA